MALIYKLVTADLWQAAQERGVLEGMPVDIADGYIHFSDAGQLRETARKHFSGQANLVLLAVPAEPLGDALKWEISRGGALFPHLYASLSITQVAQALPLRADSDGNPILPDTIP